MPARSPEQCESTDDVFSRDPSEGENINFEDSEAASEEDVIEDSDADDRSEDGAEEGVLDEGSAVEDSEEEEGLMNIKLKMWDFGQCDSKRCSGRKLKRHGKVSELPKTAPFKGIILSALATKVLSPADRSIVLKKGICVIDCSWNRISEIPMPSNPCHYGRPFELNCAEAIAATLFISGLHREAAWILSSFKWGHAFFELNESALDGYAEAKDEKGVLKIQAKVIVGFDCCVAYDEPIILTLTGTLTTTLTDLSFGGRRDSTAFLASLTENILLTRVTLTNRKLIGVSNLTDPNNIGQLCIYVDYSAIKDIEKGSKVSLSVSSLNVFELVDGRCKKGVTKINGSFDLAFKFRNMTEDIMRLLHGLWEKPGTHAFLDLITPDLLKLFWGQTTTTTWASRISRLRNELVRLCFMNEGIIVVSSSPTSSTGVVSEVLHTDRLLFAFRRCHGKNERDLELFYVKNCKKVESILLRFFSDHDYQLSVQACSPRLFLAQRNPKFIEHISSLWINGKIGNFHYLGFLNTLGGRSLNDYTTYAVYPWTLSEEFTCGENLSQLIQGASSKSDVIGMPAFLTELRDLTKPIGAQDPHRLSDLLEKHKYLDEPGPSYLYGSHYSNSSYVSYWMVRKHYETNMLINEGRLDLLARSFTDVCQAWQRAKKENNCFMELVPELYQNDPAILEAVMEEDKWELLPAVQVHCKNPFTKCQCEQKCACNPSWLANDALWFLFVHRLILESPQVSSQLHAWIDLVFGYKQCGEEAEKQYNVFHPSCYLATAVGSDLVPGSTHAVKEYDENLVIQALEFGQCPIQVFTAPHPPRQCSSSIWTKPLTVKDIWDNYVDFCSTASSSILSSSSWVEYLLKHPRSFPPIARVPSILYCSAKDYVVIRHTESEPRIWSGLASTSCLSNVMPATMYSRPNGELQYEVCSNELVCRYTTSGRYKVFTAFDHSSTDIYETSVPYKITKAVWDNHRHLYFGTQDGSIFVGGIGSHYQDGLASAADPPMNLIQRKGHRGSITALACSRSRLVSGCVRETVNVWDLDASVPLLRAEGWHSSRITALDYLDASSVVYSADAAGTFAVHDIRCPPWRAEAFPTIQFEQNWFVSSLRRLPNSCTIQLVLADQLGFGLSNKAVLTLDMLTCKAVCPPVMFADKSQIVYNNVKVKGVSATTGPVGVIEHEGSDALLVMHDKDLMCVKDSKILKTWELPCKMTGASVTSLHAFPKLTDSGTAILVPFVRAYSSAGDQCVMIT